MASGDRTKCKTCFGGPRMILHAHWKKNFSKIEVWLFATLRDPPSPGLAKDQTFYGFFWSPSQYIKGWNVSSWGLALSEFVPHSPEQVPHCVLNNVKSESGSSAWRQWSSVALATGFWHLCSWPGTSSVPECRLKGWPRQRPSWTHRR